MTEFTYLIGFSCNSKINEVLLTGRHVYVTNHPILNEKDLEEIEKIIESDDPEIYNVCAFSISLLSTKEVN